MTRFLPLALVVAVLAPAPALADAGSDYNQYARLRERVEHCVLDRNWHQLSDHQRRICKKMRPLYSIWTDDGESNMLHLHCLTSKCPPRPVGEPNPRAAIPSGAKVYKP
jgi:hypothetical protein